MFFQLAAHDDTLFLPVPSPQPAARATALPSPAARSGPAQPEALTERQVEVFRLLANSLTKPQIAERLTLNFHTVNAHVRSIYAKVGGRRLFAPRRHSLRAGTRAGVTVPHRMLSTCRALASSC